MTTYEKYIWKLLRQKEKELEDFLKEPLIFDTTTGKDKIIRITEADDSWPYWGKFHMLSGQIDILYQILTGHDNKYNEESEKKENKKKGKLFKEKAE